MKFQLRPYQKRFCRGVVDAFENGVDGDQITRALGVAATGAGKTIMASALVWYWRQAGDRSLFLADSDELCSQAVTKLHTSADIIADLEKAESRASLKSKVVVGSIQTMQSPARLDRFPHDHFRRVIADEAHLSLAGGWQRVLQRFNAGGATILGITATPERGDRKKLMGFYQHKAAEISLQELITGKYLSPITVVTAPIEIGVQGEIHDDADDDELAGQIEPYWNAVLDQVEKIAADRKAMLFFHPSRASSQKFTDLCVDRGIVSAHVDGFSRNRAEILERFERGEIRILNNAQLLVKGYDCPRIDVVCVLRPVKSRTAYIQMVGRGTRLFCPHGCGEWCDHVDRKQDCLLLDFLWEFEGHDVMGPADLLTDKPEARQMMREKFRTKGGDLIATETETTREREGQLVRALSAGRGRQKRVYDAVAWAAALHQPHLLEYEPEARWETKKPTPRQLEVLERHGVDVSGVRTRGMAAQLMGVITDRIERKVCSPKQAIALRARGYTGSLDITMAEASALLS